MRTRSARSASAHGVDPVILVAAVIETESGWDPDAKSGQGARGLMQLMPETAQDMVNKGLVDGSLYSADDLEDPAVNIEFGSAYLSYLITYFNGRRPGHRRLQRRDGQRHDWVQQDTSLHNSSTTFPETQAYLIRVNNAHDRYRQLYPDAFM